MSEITKTDLHVIPSHADGDQAIFLHDGFFIVPAGADVTIRPELSCCGAYLVTFSQARDVQIQVSAEIAENLGDIFGVPVEPWPETADGVDSHVLPFLDPSQSDDEGED